MNNDIKNKMMISEFHRGVDLVLDIINHKDGAGVAYDYAGSTFMCQIRDVDDILLSGVTVTVIADGELRLTAEDTAGWALGDYYWDCIWTPSGDRPKWLFTRSILRILDGSSEVP